MDKDEELDELANHIPWYPDPVKDISNYNKLIYSKHEYRMHAATAPRQNKVYFNHQRLGQIHLGSQTPNRTLLVFKPPGLGKTCEVIGEAETRYEWLGQVLNTADADFLSKEMNKAVIVAQNNTSLVENFKSDIMDVCTSGSYVTEALQTKTYQTTSKRLAARTTSMQSYYEFETHGTLAGKLKKMSPEQIAKTYSFRPIIIDEVHAYKALTKKVIDDNGNIIEVGNKKLYDNTMKLIDNVYGCLIIIISATPIVNDIDEFPSIINFILEKKNRVDPQYFSSMTNTNDLALLKKNMTEYLLPRILGKVSRMKITQTVSKTVIRSNERGVKTLKVSNNKVWLNTISNDNTDYIDFTYLTNAYINAVNRDGDDSKFHLFKIYASNMIWPDGKADNDSFDKYLTASAETGSYKFTYSFMEDFRKQIRNSRTYVASRLRAEIAELKTRYEKEPSQEIKDDIDYKEEYANELEQRNRDQQPDENPDPENDSDLNIMLYTIESRYSPTYASAIRKIIGIERYNERTGLYEYIVESITNSVTSGKDNRECAYVFNYYKPGGIVPFGLFMELFGYELFPFGEVSLTSGNKIELQPRKRYALLFSSSDSGSTIKMSDTQIRRILEVANHPANKFGHYLKVIIGTSVTSQSINFKNIRQAHLTGRGWNEATNIQTEGRVDRPGNSHMAFDDSEPLVYFNFTDYETGKDSKTPVGTLLLESNPNPTQKYVKIFRHVSYFKDLNYKTSTGIENASIDLKMYDDAAIKELKIGIPLEIAERAAYDYKLNIQANETLKNVPLAFGDGPVVKEDYVTYNLFYARKELEYIKCRIRGLFKTHFQATLDYILDYCKESHRSTIIKALTEMVNDNERIIDRHGMLNYLRESGDTFFLQKQQRGLISRSENHLAYYSSHNFVRTTTNIPELYSKFEYENLQKVLAIINKKDVRDIDGIENLLNLLSNTSKQQLVEIVASRYKSLIAEKRIRPEIIDIVFNIMKRDVFFASTNGILIHTYFLRSRQENQSGGHQNKLTIPNGSKRELRFYSIKEGKWRNSDYAEDMMYIPLLNSTIIGQSVASVVSFEVYGTSVIQKDYHKFSTQDKQSIESSKRLTQKEVEAKNISSTEGQEAYNWHAPQLLWQLYSIVISLDVMVYLFPKQDIGYRSITPIVLVRLKEMKGGQFKIGEFEYDFYTDNSGGVLIVSNVENIDWTKVYSRHYVHYTKVYPEILGWIFEDEMAKLGSKQLSSDPLFYPTISSSRYQPMVPPLEEGSSEYTSIFELLPNGNREILADILGKGERTGYMKFIKDKRFTFASTGKIATSLNLLYKMLIEGKLIDGREDVIGYEIQHQKTKAIIKIGERFAVAMNFSKKDSVVLLFILFKLRDSIIYK